VSAQLLKFWQSRAPRERIVLVVIAVILSVALYLWLLQTTGRARAQLKDRIPLLHTQMAQLDHNAADYEQARHAPAIKSASGDLRTVAQAEAETAGISRRVIRMDVVDANQIQAVFGDVPFASWLTWISNLQTRQVRLDSCRIEASSQPGLVNISATLIRPAAL
jgi:general secretion pathway protein M